MAEALSYLSGNLAALWEGAAQERRGNPPAAATAFTFSARGPA